MGYRGGHTVHHGPRKQTGNTISLTNHNGYNSGYNSNKMDQQMSGDQTMCLCFRMLNPLGSYLGTGMIPSTSLAHYCRVCNIQLNSCRQAKIHCEGKKHEKRLSYLKLCLESTGEIPGPLQANCPPPGLATSTGMVQTSMTNTNMVPPPPVSVNASMPPPPLQQLQQQMPPITTTAIYSFQPALSYQQCSPTLQPPPLQAMQAPPPANYYYPQTTYHSMPPQQQPQQTYHTGYHDYITASMQPPPLMQTIATMPPPPVSTNTLMSIAPPTMIMTSGHPGMLQQQQQQHGVMSPSLTSGFSGSGDCKSTETSSILSAASYSSVGAVATVVSEANYLPRKGFHDYGMEAQEGYYFNNNNFYSGHVQHVPPYSGQANSGNSGMMKSSASQAMKSRGSVAASASFCDVCQMSFPSNLVLENHVKGSRHARKVKSQQAFRQLKESGTNFHQDEEGGGEIRCEVCQVSVNSSQQLQAHLIGHKHRVRAVRRGVKTNQAILSPSSSTATSSSTSEVSFVTNANNNINNSNNNNNHVKSNKHQFLTAAGSSSNTVVADSSPQLLQQPRSRRTSSGAALSRNLSSGCLSRHCHSTLSLSRAKSSSALNKVRSRSMNLLVLCNNAESSTSSDECEVESRQRGAAGAKRRSQNQVNGRPRSFSVRTASITKDEKPVTFRDLACSKVEKVSKRKVERLSKDSEAATDIANLTSPEASTDTAKKTSGDAGTENGRWNNEMRIQQNQHDQMCNKHQNNQVHHHTHHNNNNNNSNNNNNNNISSKNNKTRSFVPPPPGSEWSKPRRTSVGNALKEVPMLDVFLERLKPTYNNSRNSSNNNNNSKTGDSNEIMLAK